MILEKLLESDAYERYKFMEGAVWMGKKNLEETEALCENYNEIVTDMEK